MNLSKDDAEIIDLAKRALMKAATINPKYFGEVACAIKSKNGKIYFAVCTNIFYGVGNAEYKVFGKLVEGGEREIEKMVVVLYDSKNDKFEIAFPCGRAREMMEELSEKNLNCEIIVSKDKKVSLSEIYELCIA